MNWKMTQFTINGGIYGKGGSVAVPVTISFSVFCLLTVFKVKIVFFLLKNSVFFNLFNFFCNSDDTDFDELLDSLCDNQFQLVFIVQVITYKISSI